MTESIPIWFIEQEIAKQKDFLKRVHVAKHKWQTEYHITALEDLIMKWEKQNEISCYRLDNERLF